MLTCCNKIITSEFETYCTVTSLYPKAVFKWQNNYFSGKFCYTGTEKLPDLFFGIRISISFRKKKTVTGTYPDPADRVNSNVSKLELIFLLMTQQPLVGQDFLINGSSRSRSDTPYSVGLLWTSDRTDAETSTRDHTTLTRNRYPCPRRDLTLIVLMWRIGWAHNNARK